MLGLSSCFFSGLEGKNLPGFPSSSKMSFACNQSLIFWESLRVPSLRGWWQEDVLIPFSAHQRLSALLLGPTRWPPQAERQMADGEPRQCYREMMIRLQGSGWWRETSGACRFSPHYNHCSKMDLCHPVGGEARLGGLCWQSCLQTGGDKGDLKSGYSGSI